MPTTGGAATRLTTNPAYDEQPVWSPDGKLISFASDRNGSADVYVMPAKAFRQRNAMGLQPRRKLCLFFRPYSGCARKRSFSRWQTHRTIPGFSKGRQTGNGCRNTGRNDFFCRSRQQGISLSRQQRHGGPVEKTPYIVCNSRHMVIRHCH